MLKRLIFGLILITICTFDLYAQQTIARESRHPFEPYGWASIYGGFDDLNEAAYFGLFFVDNGYWNLGFSLEYGSDFEDYYTLKAHLHVPIFESKYLDTSFLLGAGGGYADYGESLLETESAGLQYEGVATLKLYFLMLSYSYGWDEVQEFEYSLARVGLVFEF